MIICKDGKIKDHTHKIWNSPMGKMACSPTVAIYIYAGLLRKQETETRDLQIDMFVLISPPYQHASFFSSKI